MMLELPESKNLAKQIKENLLGKTIMNVMVNKSPHKFAWFSHDEYSYHDKLVEKSITDTDAYGGMVEILIDDMRLVFFDGTNLRFYAQGEKLPDKHQLHIEFDDFSSFICSVQMYGGILLFDNTELDNPHYHDSKTKVSPLSDKNTEDYFLDLMDSVKQTYSVKAFLATEQRYPGLGNGVLQDILFNAKIHPRRKLASLSQQEKTAIYNSLKQTLLEMTLQGGRDTEKDIFGQPGGYQTKLSAKTKLQPCPDCGDDIVKEAFMGGAIYFCPTCQKFEKAKR